MKAMGAVWGFYGKWNVFRSVSGMKAEHVALLIIVFTLPRGYRNKNIDTLWQWIVAKQKLLGF